MRGLSGVLLLALSVSFLACRAPGEGTASDSGAGGPDAAGLAGGDGGTWYRDVLPIVQDHCQQCHVPGGVGPFPLVTYQDGFTHNTLMASAVQQALMPPWKPQEGCQSFVGDRSISQALRNTIINWSAAGAAEGNPADAPPPPDAGFLGLPHVDLELDAGFDYTPSQANGPDDYHCFILYPGQGATPQATTQDVTGVNIVPGHTSLVHHVILFQTTLAKALAAEAATPGQGWTCFGSPGTGDFNMVGGWVPGSPPQVFPAGTGVPLLAGNVVVMQVHYNMATVGAQPDRTLAQLAFSPTPVPRPAQILGPIDTSFIIPPNAQGYTDSMTITVPTALTIWGVQPHMHTKGTEISVNMTDPSGHSTCLADIPQWNFHWQQMYFYTAPLSVAAGTTVTLQCTWNNPTAQAVRFGEGTADEMCLAFFYATK